MNPRGVVRVFVWAAFTEIRYALYGRQGLVVWIFRDTAVLDESLMRACRPRETTAGRSLPLLAITQSLRAILAVFAVPETRTGMPD